MWANPLRCAASCGAPLQRPTPRWPRTGRPKRGRPDYRHSARGHEGGMVARKRPAVFWTPGQVGRSITRPVREVNQRRPLGASSYSKVDKARRRLQPSLTPVVSNRTILRSVTSRHPSKIPPLSEAKMR